MGLRKFVTTEDVQDFPICKTESERQAKIQEYIEAGAIPKSKLENGAWYIGHCRNTGIAQWWEKDGFIYPRYKLGETFIDHVDHFEDDTEYDVFVPIKKVYPDENPRKVKNFHYLGEIVSWEELPMDVREHDYPYYFNEKGEDCYPNKVNS